MECYIKNFFQILKFLEIHWDLRVKETLKYLEEVPISKPLLTEIENTLI